MGDGHQNPKGWRWPTWALVMWTGLAAIGTAVAVLSPVVVCDPTCASMQAGELIAIAWLWLLGTLALTIRWYLGRPRRPGGRTD